VPPRKSSTLSFQIPYNVALNFKKLFQNFNPSPISRWTKGTFRRGFLGHTSTSPSTVGTEQLLDYFSYSGKIPPTYLTARKIILWSLRSQLESYLVTFNPKQETLSRQSGRPGPLSMGKK
jgi:hypothetical protein